MGHLINNIEGISRWPKKLSDKKIVLQWLSLKFVFKKQYSEQEINKIIKGHHSFDDIALLRRELISKKFLQRKNNGSKYCRIN